jgi:hypothetical protein
MIRAVIDLALLFALLMSPALARAGALRPCIKATLSANGNILVVNELAFDDPDETRVRKVQRSKFTCSVVISPSTMGSVWADPTLLGRFAAVERGLSKQR